MSKKRTQLSITVKFGEITQIGDVHIQLHERRGAVLMRIVAPKDAKINRDILNARAKNREKKNAENVQADEKSASVASQRVDSLSGDPVAQSSDRVTGGGNG